MPQQEHVYLHTAIQVVQVHVPQFQSSGKTLRGSILSFVGDEQVISLQRASPRILRFCIMPWKGEREPTIKNWHGKTG